MKNGMKKSRERKSLKFALLAMAACLAFTGCTGSGLPVKEEDNTQKTSVAALALEGEKAEEKTEEVVLQEETDKGSDREKGKLRSVSALEYMNYNISAFQTEEGYYSAEILKSKEMYGDQAVCHQLVYTDFATRQKKVLCTKDGCSHDNVECSAYFESVMGPSRIFEAGGKIVVIRPYEERYSSLVSEDAEYPEPVLEEVYPGSVSVMDMDGGNARVIKDSIKDFESFWLTDDSYIYGTRYDVEEIAAEEGVEGSMSYEERTKGYLISINLETGETKDLMDLPSVECFPVGELDGDILMLDTVYPEDIPKDNWEERYEGSTSTYIKVDTETGKSETVASGLSRFFQVGRYAGDGEVYFSRGNPLDGAADKVGIYKVNLKTLEEELVFRGDENCLYGIESMNDEEMILWYEEYESLYNEKGQLSWIDIGLEKEIESYGYVRVDRKTGEQQKASLLLEYEIKYGEETEINREFVMPLADAGDYYLVDCSAAMDGILILKQQALILKTDFWAGNANYIPVTVV